ncbi:MAG: hypothetical protein CSB55_02435 [Candidatus Cloacimonadota bacterium]|nr:MAG: hypothetical protein CSB55_02435 [Candidatus Cloacimonadota bacterium]
MKIINIIAAFTILSSTAFADLTVIKNQNGKITKEYNKNDIYAVYEENSLSLFNLKTDKVININREKRTYSESTLNNYNKSFREFMQISSDKQIEAVVKQLKKSREEVEKMMFGQIDKQYEMSKQIFDSLKDVKAEKKENIEHGGLIFETYAITSEDEVIKYVWICPELLNIQKENVNVDKLYRILDDINDIAVDFQEEVMLRGKELPEDPIFNKTDELRRKGYFIFEMNADGLNTEPEADFPEITVSDQEIDSAIFEIPKDYKKISVIEMMEER